MFELCKLIGLMLSDKRGTCVQRKQLVAVHEVLKAEVAGWIKVEAYCSCSSTDRPQNKFAVLMSESSLTPQSS